jgi:hypothetical protein
MAPVAVVLNLRTHARTAVCNGDYQRGRPTTGIKQPTDRHQLVLQPSNWHSLPLQTYPKWNKLRCTAWLNPLPSWRGGRVHRSGTARAVRFIWEEGVTKVFSDTLRWYLPCFACWFVVLHVFNLPNKSTSEQCIPIATGNVFPRFVFLYLDNFPNLLSECISLKSCVLW